MGTKLIPLLLVALFTNAQETPTWFASIHPDFTNFGYPPLARAARIMGRVTLTVSASPSKIEDPSGHPLLVPSARQNLETWHYDPPLVAPLIVDYVFRLTESGSVSHRVLRGDPFDRFFLRIFKQPVYRDEQECRSSGVTNIEGPMIVDKSEHVVRIIVTTDVGCLMTDRSLARSD